jgi:hypothetical protein
MIDPKYMAQTVFAIGLIILASYFATHVKQNYLVSNSDEDELIRKYLLNDHPLYGLNRPKLWIHTTYEYNARKWQSFGSRSSTDLNQPYIHLTVKSIINQCGNDFNICLIDDDSFSRLLPTWKYRVTSMPEGERDYYRQLGLLSLLYTYGGMIVPNSFVCLQNLAGLYSQGIQGNTPFILEKPNKHAQIASATGKRAPMTPDLGFMGSVKANSTIAELIEFVKGQRDLAVKSSEMVFFDPVSQWCSRAVDQGRMVLIDGGYIGTKSRTGRPILLENLMSESAEELDVCPRSALGIVIPADEVLSRIKYQWFSVMSAEELLGTNLNIVPWLLRSIVPQGDRVSETVIAI